MLSVSEIRTLIKERPGISLRDLALHFRVSPGMMEMMVSKLVDRGDVETVVLRRRLRLLVGRPWQALQAHAESFPRNGSLIAEQLSLETIICTIKSSALAKFSTSVHN